jgi:hypothetical protein
MPSNVNYTIHSWRVDVMANRLNRNQRQREAAYRQCTECQHITAYTLAITAKHFYQSVRVNPPAKTSRFKHTNVTKTAGFMPPNTNVKPCTALTLAFPRLQC